MIDQATLQKFCANEDIRQYLEKPFRKNGYLYASNGHICIRIPDDSNIQAIEAPSQIDPEKFFSNSVTEWHLLPENLPPPKPCSNCNGEKIVSEKVAEPCPDCDGEGDFTHGEHTYTCKECDGEGYIHRKTQNKVTCPECTGTGENIYNPVQIGAANYSRTYLALIQSLPGAKIEHVPEHDSWRVCRFIFDGGEGAVMPQRA